MVKWQKNTRLRKGENTNMYIGRPAFIEQLNDISFWYPILKKIGMRTPETRLFYTQREIGKIIDGERTDGFEKLVEDIKKALGDFGGKAFLRTGQTSNKHDWKNACFLDSPENIDRQLYNLIEFSMIVDLPYTTFAVRELIKTKPIGIAFNNMPIAQEVRLFIENGKVVCVHPYWAEEAFKHEKTINSEQIKELNSLPQDMAELQQMAEYVSRCFRLAWSCDFLQDAKGDWWLTDMALANTSYHYKGCPNEHKWDK